MTDENIHINSNIETQTDNHNLDTAGDVLGLTYNTNKFDPNYNRKKGMRFFLVLIVFLFFTSIILVSLRSFPDVQIMYAADDNIIVQNIKTNTFGISRIASETMMDYNYDNYVYDMMRGKTAQIAYLINKLSVELLVADESVLEGLAKNWYLTDIGLYLNSSYEDKLVKMTYKSSSGLLYINYGAKLEENGNYSSLGNEKYIAVINGDISKLNVNYKTPMVAEFAEKVIDGEPLSAGIRDYHSAWKGNY